MRKHQPDCGCRACRIRRNWRNESPLLDTLVLIVSGAVLGCAFMMDMKYGWVQRLMEQW